MIIMVINASKKTGLAPYSGADVKSVLFYKTGLDCEQLVCRDSTSFRGIPSV